MMAGAYSGEPRLRITPGEIPIITLLHTDCDGSVPEGDVLLTDRSQRPLRRAGPDQKRYWREMMGTFLRNEMGLCPELPNDTIFCLEFPRNYELYASERSSGVRWDGYLVGFFRDGTKKKFDSPANFVMHAKWIAYGCPPNACQCRPCTGRLQGEISKHLTLGGAKISQPRDEERRESTRRARERGEVVRNARRRNVRRAAGETTAGMREGRRREGRRVEG